MNPAPKLQPAFFGGLFIGVLSALPLVNIGNCCCLWVIGGGVLAAYLMQQNHPYADRPPPTARSSGLLAGLIGGVLGTLLSIPVEMMMGPFQQQLMERMLASNPDIPPETRAMIENMSAGGGGAIGVQAGVLASSSAPMFGMLGGLLGVALFKKKDLPPPPGTVEVLPPA